MNFLRVLLLRLEISFGALTADRQSALMLFQARTAQLHLVHSIMIALY
jgi:hypothetical protein